ncbi:MAG: Bax inhibitor-1 family protein [Planctomycetota bacterium]
MSQTYPQGNSYEFEADEVQARMADAVDRASFVTKTYSILFLSIAAFIGVEVYLFQSGLADKLFHAGGSLLFFALFVVAGWVATRFAERSESLLIQFLALAGFIVAEAVFFAPLLVYATKFVDPDGSKGVLVNSVGFTLVGFAALTAVVFTTRRDFSFLRSFLLWGGLSAFALIVSGLIFGFSLGPIFWIAMVAFAGASILYDTSNVIHHYPSTKYVAAALQLFASVAVLFWYVLRLVMHFSSDD